MKKDKHGRKEAKTRSRSEAIRLQRERLAIDPRETGRRATDRRVTDCWARTRRIRPAYSAPSGDVAKPFSSANWFPDWRNDVAAIIASGTSTTSAQLEAIRGKCRSIVVNSSVYVAPWADVLYAADLEWWIIHAKRLKFHGLKLSASYKASRFDPDVKLVNIRRRNALYVDEFVFKPKGEIGRGGSGGFQAINLAVQFGTRRLILIGLDFKLGDNGAIHHHGNHPPGLRNPTAALLAKWGEILDQQAPALVEAGVQVVNVSPTSALRNFRKANLTDVLNEWLPNPSQPVLSGQNRRFDETHMSTV